MTTSPSCRIVSKPQGSTAGRSTGSSDERTAGALEAFQAQRRSAGRRHLRRRTIAALDRAVGTDDGAGGGRDTTLSTVLAPPRPPPPVLPPPPTDRTTADGSPSERHVGTTLRNLLIGFSAAIVLIVAFLYWLGGESDGTATEAASDSVVSAGLTPATAASTAAVAPETSTTPPAIEPTDLFGVVVDFPSRPTSPLYVVDRSKTVPDVVDDCDAVDWARERGAMVSEGGADFEPTSSIIIQATDLLDSSGTAVLLTDMQLEVMDSASADRRCARRLPAAPVDRRRSRDHGQRPFADLRRRLPGDRLPDRRDPRRRRGHRVGVGVPRQRLVAGESIVVDLTVDSGSCDCDWIIVLEMVIDGERVWFDVTQDDGRPFRTSASNGATPLFPPAAAGAVRPRAGRLTCRRLG